MNNNNEAKVHMQVKVAVTLKQLPCILTVNMDSVVELSSLSPHLVSVLWNYTHTSKVKYFCYKTNF
jgi:hypothetical protein